jgi:hypothetical protein
MVVTVCALLASAEYSELDPREDHTCPVPRIERVDAFDPWTDGWYGLVVYHCCRRVGAPRKLTDVTAARSAESQAEPWGMPEEHSAVSRGGSEPAIVGTVQTALSAHQFTGSVR